ncbi:MAG: hypothetical protein JSW71_21570 [Gemmatimonadota bacterium]|nr:MAG: hypothetical protein JSW71_21570 [Gemmatimonadota bacterium]
MQRFRSRQLRFVLVPLMAVSLLAACGGYRVQQMTPEMERWTPTLEPMGPADLMRLPTAERLACQTGDSPAASGPASMSTGHKIVLATLTAVIAVGVTVNHVVTSFYRDFCPFCGTWEPHTTGRQRQTL